MTMQLLCCVGDNKYDLIHFRRNLTKVENETINQANLYQRRLLLSSAFDPPVKKIYNHEWKTKHIVSFCQEGIAFFPSVDKCIRLVC